PETTVGGGRCAQQISGRLARKVPVVEPRSIARKQDLGSELTAEGRAGGIFSSANRAEKLIRHAGLGDVKDDAIPGLSMIQDEIGCRSRSVAFVVKVMGVHKENTTQRKKKH